jgi:hypothetical protein
MVRRTGERVPGWRSTGCRWATRLASFFVSDAARRVRERRLVPGVWSWTDDTAMTIGIVETLVARGGVDQDELARRFAARYVAERGRGYGRATHRTLSLVHAGRHWQPVSHGQFSGRGSYGNGAAMRAPVVGAWFADDLDEVVRAARLSAEVTHAHPEASAGAIAVALAAALACHGEQGPAGAGLIAAVLDRLPDGDVRRGSERALGLEPASPIERAVAVLGDGAYVSAQDTVPLVCGARPISCTTIDGRCGRPSARWATATPPARWSAASSPVASAIRDCRPRLARMPRTTPDPGHRPEADRLTTAPQPGRIARRGEEPTLLCCAAVSRTRQRFAHPPDLSCASKPKPSVVKLRSGLSIPRSHSPGQTNPESSVRASCPGAIRTSRGHDAIASTSRRVQQRGAPGGHAGDYGGSAWPAATAGKRGLASDRRPRDHAAAGGATAARWIACATARAPGPSTIV